MLLGFATEHLVDRVLDVRATDVVGLTEQLLVLVFVVAEPWSTVAPPDCAHPWRGPPNPKRVESVDGVGWFATHLAVSGGRPDDCIGPSIRQPTRATPTSPGALSLPWGTALLLRPGSSSGAAATQRGSGAIAYMPGLGRARYGYRVNAIAGSFKPERS
jgi:hypothetical protein